MNTNRKDKKMNTTTTNRIDLVTSSLSGNVQKPQQPGKLVAVAAIIGALMYLISPLDLIPDVVPIVCHLDDIGVIAAAWKFAKSAFGPPPA